MSLSIALLAAFFPVETEIPIDLSPVKVSLGTSFKPFRDSQSKQFFKTAEISPLYSGLETTKPDDDFIRFLINVTFAGVPYFSISELKKGIGYSFKSINVQLKPFLINSFSKFLC